MPKVTNAHKMQPKRTPYAMGSLFFRSAQKKNNRFGNALSAAIPANDADSNLLPCIPKNTKIMPNKKAGKPIPINSPQRDDGVRNPMYLTFECCGALSCQSEREPHLHSRFRVPTRRCLRLCPH